MVGILGIGFGVGLGYAVAYLIMNPNGMMGTYLDLPRWRLCFPWFCYLVLLGILSPFVFFCVHTLPFFHNPYTYLPMLLHVECLRVSQNGVLGWYPNGYSHSKKLCLSPLQSGWSFSLYLSLALIVSRGGAIAAFMLILVIGVTPPRPRRIQLFVIEGIARRGCWRYQFLSRTYRKSLLSIDGQSVAAPVDLVLLNHA